jgi:hypothetical protein
VDFFVYQRLAPVYIVANLTGATPSASFQYATANSHPLRAGKQPRKLTRMAKLTTLPFERKKLSAPARLATGNIPPVMVRPWFVLSDLTTVRVVKLSGIKNAGVKATQLDKLAG